jgi:hypothetical protein
MQHPESFIRVRSVLFTPGVPCAMTLVLYSRKQGTKVVTQSTSTTKQSASTTKQSAYSITQGTKVVIQSTKVITQAAPGAIQGTKGDKQGTSTTKQSTPGCYGRCEFDGMCNVGAPGAPTLHLINTLS